MSDEGLGQPGSLADLFELLGQHRILDADLVQRLRRAAGVRNIIVHEYVKLDLALVHRIALNGLSDLDAFLLAIADHARNDASA